MPILGKTFTRHTSIAHTNQGTFKQLNENNIGSERRKIIMNQKKINGDMPLVFIKLKTTQRQQVKNTHSYHLMCVHNFSR